MMQQLIPEQPPQFEWSQSGLILLEHINRMIADNGGYALYRCEAILENMNFVYGKEQSRLRRNIQTIKYNNRRRNRFQIERDSARQRNSDHFNDY